VLLHLHDLGLGGAERIALQWAVWLTEDGHEVTLLLGRAASDAFYSLPEGLPCIRRPTTSADPRSWLPTWWWLRAWLRRHPPDLAIGVTTRPSLNLLLASFGRAWPVVVAERNYPPARRLPWIWRWLRRLLYPAAALHLVQTERIGQWLLQQGLAQRCRVVPNPVLWPLPRQEPVQSPSLWLGDAMRLVLAVGTKPDQKGFDRLLEAFALVAPDHPDWRLALVGVSANHPQLASGLTRLGLFRQRVRKGRSFCAQFPF
jgi:glycosyltransferase involved in cell wall biosynthesis